MSEHSHRHKNSSNGFAKSFEYILSQARKGSAVHIAILAGGALLILLILGLIIWGISRSGSGKDGKDGETEINEMDLEYDKDREAIDTRELGATVLEYTQDRGQDYVDETLFIGDSNTVRTMLYGHTTWDNVVAATSMGVRHIHGLKMTYFKGYSEPVTVPEAVRIIQPKRIIITYGTNDLLKYTTEEFIRIYKAGLKEIHDAYPYADIIINAIPPIDRQRENLALTMQRIDEYNKAIAEMADEEGYKFLNSSEALKDPNSGFAKTNYTIGDGVHLSKLGMEALFNYVRTHAYITTDKRPKPLNKVPEREETPTGIIEEDPIAVRGTRIRILFKSSDPELGTVDGEVEQKIKRTMTTSRVTAKPNSREGAIFTGWTCSYEGLSDSERDTVTFKVPQVDDSVTEIVITANFSRTGIEIRDGSERVTDITMKKGEEKTVNAVLSGNYKGDAAITWESDDKSIVLVDPTGKLSAINGGTTTIYASILGGKIYASCRVTVDVELEGLTITGNSSLEVGEVTNLSVAAYPQGAKADLSLVKWSSSDESVATVDRSGAVTAKGMGTATITAEVSGKSGQFTVNVTQRIPLESISLSGENEFYEGESVQLSVSYQPRNTTDLKIESWSTSDTSVATVSEGKVFGMSSGTAVITCTVGDKSASITVTVKAVPQAQPDEPEEPTPEGPAQGEGEQP
ncbi:MAG: Ig-like domain-containing protein [Oscillospiraceae bacterium]|nr:Ig-like domain-containing protein [Oscillospiraceae bacterium]